MVPVVDVGAAAQVGDLVVGDAVEVGLDIGGGADAHEDAFGVGAPGGEAHVEQVIGEPVGGAGGDVHGAGGQGVAGGFEPVGGAGDEPVGVTLGAVGPGEGAAARHQPEGQKSDEDAEDQRRDPARLHGIPSVVLVGGESSWGRQGREGREIALQVRSGPRRGRTGAPGAPPESEPRLGLVQRPVGQRRVELLSGGGRVSGVSRAVCCLLLTAFLVSTPAMAIGDGPAVGRAQPRVSSPAGPDFRISPVPDPDYQFYPAAAYNPDKKQFLVVWSDTRNAGDSGGGQCRHLRTGLR